MAETRAIHLPLTIPNLYRGFRLQVVRVMDSTPCRGQSISRKEKSTKLRPSRAVLTAVGGPWQVLMSSTLGKTAQWGRSLGPDVHFDKTLSTFQWVCRRHIASGPASALEGKHGNHSSKKKFSRHVATGVSSTATESDRLIESDLENKGGK